MLGKAITVPAKGDVLHESKEFFRLNLVVPVNAAIAGRNLLCLRRRWA
jgi:hypothetical protein